MSYEEDIKHLGIKGPGEIIDLTCTSCKNKYESKGAIRYCARCQEYSFVSCIDDLPDVYYSKDMEAEDILHSRKGNDIPAESSQQREGSVWSCSVNVPVMSSDHCKIINKRIAKIGHRPPEERMTPRDNGIQQDQKICVNDLMENMIKIQEQYQKHLNKLEEMKETCLKDLHTFRIEINNVIDRLEQKTVTEIEDTLKEKEKELANKIKGIQEVFNGLNRMNHETNEQLVQYCKNITKALEEESDIESDIVFTRNLKLFKFLDSLHSLGLCDFNEKQDLYQVQSSEAINIRHESDTEICSVHSCCFTSSGDILMSDYKNMNIKLIDGSDYTVKDVLSFQLHPLSVCEVKANESAVTLAETKYLGGDTKIQFISTDSNRLVPIRSIKLDHYCSGIGVVDDMIYVSNERKRVYVYDVKGKLHRTIYLDQTGNEIFSKSYAIIRSQNKKRVHITDLDRGLVTLDTDGHLLWRFSGRQLQMAWAVSTDGKGNIFVSGGNSGNVVQIGSDGTCLGEVISESDSIKDPQAICFDKRTSKLIVAKYNSNDVHVFSIV